MAATKKAPAPAPLADAELARLASDVVRRVRERGAVARTELDVPRGVVALVADRLTAAGLELRPKVVRVPLEEQLVRRLVGGSFPLRGVEKQIAGATRAEARAALGKLVTAKRAIVLRGDAEGEVAAPAADVLTPADRARVAAVAKALTALAKPSGKSPLAPRTRWADVIELVDDVLGRRASDTMTSDMESSRARAPEGAPAARASGASGASGPSGPSGAGLEDQLIAALRTSRDDSGIASIAAAGRLLVPSPETEAFCDALRALAARGDIELRIASQPHLLSAQEREVCPTDPAGRVLAYARVVGS